MADGVIYLDVDDEITSVAGRIRRVEAERVAAVLPYGSRVATSRINFRLLARDAASHGRRLSIVAPDAATRALAASAGLPVFASVAEYEGSLVERAERPVSDGPGASAPARVAPTEEVVERSAAPTAAVAPAVPVPATVAPGAEPTGDGPAAPVGRARSIPVVGGRRSLVPRTPFLVAAAVAALLLLVGGVAAWTLLPSATAVVTPLAEVVGPLRFQVVADPGVRETDPVAGTVPAERLTVEVGAADTFEATGRRVEQERATGRVTFQSFNPASANTIPAGSVVSTEGGIRFETTRSITLAKAQLVPDGSGAVVIPTKASVDVRAVKAGTAGNVPANAITVVPQGEDPTLTKVRNPAETTGGTREEFPRVDQADVDAAMAVLGEQLRIAFEERLADPALGPDGATVLPATATLGEPVPTVDPATLVGQEVETFELGLDATGSVIAVDARPVEAVAARRLEERVAAGSELVEGSVAIAVGDPVVDGPRISFPVVAEARQVSIPDAAELEAAIAGLGVDEARALLEAYGSVELTVWPEWVTTVPTIDARIEVVVRDPRGAPSPGPGAGPDGSPDASP